MAKYRPIETYPKEYFSLFRMANEKPVHLEHENRTQAETTRSSLYAFRQVLYQQTEPTYQQLAILAQNIRFTITNSTLTAQPIRKIENGNNTT